MTRKRHGRPVDGILLLDKPSGHTSNGVLQQVKRLFNAQKAGHTGSLDPFATGMLPICFGQATKISSYLLNSDKRYLVSAKLGVATDSGDVTGAITASSSVPPISQANLETVLTSFIGHIEQTPPMFSALKVGGQRLYKLARQGKVLERQPRPIKIHIIKLLQVTKDSFELDVHCSKGTYIRTLIEDIGKALGTLAHTISLRRLEVQPFAGEMITLDALETMQEEERDSFLLPIDAALQHLPSVRLDSCQSHKFCQGQSLPIGTSEERLRVYDDHKLLGIAISDGSGNLRVERLLIDIKSI